MPRRLRSPGPWKSQPNTFWLHCNYLPRQSGSRIVLKLDRLQQSFGKRLDFRAADRFGIVANDALEPGNRGVRNGVDFDSWHLLTLVRFR